MDKDKYLVKVGIDFDKEQFNKIAGIISDEISSMGGVSDKFIDNALETARKYNAEIDKQRATIADIDERLKSKDLDAQTRQLLEETRAKSKKTLDKYVSGSPEEGLQSKEVVDALAAYAQSARGAADGALSFKDKLVKASSGLTKGISKFAAVMNGAVLAVNLFSSRIKEALNDFSNYAGQLNPMGAFGSKSQRDLMSRYGMSSTQAMGFANVTGAMGLSADRIGSMTADERRVFESLNKFWSEGMGKLDANALERFNKTMVDYQEIQAKFQMGLQMTVMKLVSSSPKFNEFVGKVGDLLDSVLDFMGSPAVQWVFDGLIDFLTTVISLLERGMRTISKIPGFGGVGASITNNDVNTNNVINVYGGSDTSSEELARQISYSLSGSYGG